MTVHLQRDLDKMKKDLLTMGGMVEEAIRKVMTGLIERRQDLLDEVIAEDKRIDEWENAIDEEIIHLLALHQPVADDLRLVLMAMQVNNEMERMGDHARNIARMSRKFLSHPSMAPFYDGLARAAECVLEMVTEALDSMVKRDAALARRVRRQDSRVDELCDETLDGLVAVMQRDSSLVPFSVQAVNASRNLERIADLATNIAKDVIFLVEGQIVRHGGRRAVTQGDQQIGG
ncbi:MAG: phosphate signaling complex protein PhoU [Planctomycetota bacterium]